MIDKENVKRFWNLGKTQLEISRLLGCSEGRVWQILKESGVTKSPTSLSITERLKSRLKLNIKTGCWEFNGSRYKEGYGQITINKKSYRAHRLAYSLFCGEIPEGMFVCHTCDNPPCCNPEHLFLGTPQQNVDDKVSKNRQAKEPQLPHAKNSTENIQLAKKLRSEGLSVRDVGKKVGVSGATISRWLK